jgi:hypothetical protein
VAHNFGSRLPAREGSGAATCSTAPYPAAHHGGAPILSHVPHLRTLPPSSGGLQCCRVSRGSGSHLPMRKGTSAAMCLMTPSGLGAMGINNKNPDHAARTARYRGKYAHYQGEPSSWAYKICGRRRIKCLQDVWTNG